VDFAPNKQQREVHAVLKQRLAEQKALYEAILAQDLPAFNTMLKQKNLAGIIVPEIK